MDKKLRIAGLILILVVFLLLITLFFGYQQKQIIALKKIIIPQAGTEQTGSLDANGQNQNVIPLAVAEQKKTELINDTREIRGTVGSVSGKAIKVSAEIVDLDKIKDATSEDVSTFTKIKKDFTVMTNDQTKFLGSKLSGIKNGDSIKVNTNDPVYTQDSITATIVISPVVSAGEAANSGQKFVSGKTEKIESGVLTIQAVDEKGNSTGKTYAVKAGDNTRVLKQEMSVSQPNQTPNKASIQDPNQAPKQDPNQAPIKLSDIKVGDNVTALSSEAIKDRTSFDATEIILLIALPKK